jgi:hypothetical protein
MRPRLLDVGATDNPTGRSSLVILDLNRSDLSAFRKLCRSLLPAIEDGGAIMLLHENRRGAFALDPGTILSVFPPSDQVSVRYAGSRWSHLASGIYDRLRRVLPKVVLGGFNFTALAALVAAMPAALIAAIHARFSAGDTGNPPPSCASMLLVLPVNPAVRNELERW